MLLDLLLPLACAGCGAPGSACCRACVALPDPRTVDLGGGLLCHTAGPYAPVLGKVVVAYKERGRRVLLPVLRELLAGAVSTAAAGGPVVLVGVPASPQGRRERGFDHVADLLPRELPRIRALRVVGRPADSSKLTVEERASNLSGTLAVNPRGVHGLRRLTGYGYRVVLVDDVVTTGATLREAASVLTGAGVPVAACAAVAATVRRRPAGQHARSADRQV